MEAGASKGLTTQANHLAPLRLRCTTDPFAHKFRTRRALRGWSWKQQSIGYPLFSKREMQRPIRLASIGEPNHRRVDGTGRLSPKTRFVLHTTSGPEQYPIIIGSKDHRSGSTSTKSCRHQIQRHCRAQATKRRNSCGCYRCDLRMRASRACIFLDGSLPRPS